MDTLAVEALVARAKATLMVDQIVNMTMEAASSVWQAEAVTDVIAVGYSYAELYGALVLGYSFAVYYAHILMSAVMLKAQVFDRFHINIKTAIVMSLFGTAFGSTSVAYLLGNPPGWYRSESFALTVIATFLVTRFAPGDFVTKFTGFFPVKIALIILCTLNRCQAQFRAVDAAHAMFPASLPALMIVGTIGSMGGLVFRQALVRHLTMSITPNEILAPTWVFDSGVLMSFFQWFALSVHNAGAEEMYVLRFMIAGLLVVISVLRYLFFSPPRPKVPQNNGGKSPSRQKHSAINQKGKKQKQKQKKN